jgi:polyhydroxyalkanoate synthesis regulator phasin
MAKKQTSSGGAATSQVLARFQENIRQLQRDAESVLGRTRRQTSELITRDQKRAVGRLFKEAQRLRGDLETRAHRASKDVESRAEQFLGALEKEATKRLVPLLRRLDLPSRHEVNTLARRIGQLERRLRSAEVAVNQAQGAPADERSPSGQSTELKSTS